MPSNRRIPIRRERKIKMNNESIKRTVQQLVAQNRTEEAIEFLAKSHFSNLEREIILLNSKFNKVKEELRLGVVSREDANLEFAQINVAIIEIADKLDDPPFGMSGETHAPVSGATRKRSGINPYLVVSVVLSLIIIGYVAMRGGSDKSAKPASTTPVTETVKSDPLENKYVICESTFERKEEAQRRVAQLTNKGLNGKAGFFWVPDYNCLSGEKLYQVYIGPFPSKLVARAALCKYNKANGTQAYGVLICNTSRREVVRCE
ncbi:MAG: SPOR domain-containing protein [Bacteroidetes bacterium]|nr:MAG: SPOR domain-containing protein [Bacteroidota bacterium]